MANILVKNPDVSQNIQTFLTQDYVSGTTLNTSSSSNFSNGNYFIIGEPGLETTEVGNLTAAPPTNTTMTIAPLKFSHPKGTILYYLNWDKYELSYRTTSTGAWTVYGSMPANLTFDAIFTEYRDSTATSTYGWKYRYYSTEKTTYSDYSDVISASGWARNSVGYMTREIRKVFNDPEGKTVTDTEILRFLNAGQDKIYSLYDRWWFLLKTGTAILTVAGQKSYALPSDFGRMNNVKFEYVSGATDTTYNLQFVSRIEFDYIVRDNNATNDDNTKFYSIYPPDTNSTTGYLKIAAGSGGGPLTAGLNIFPVYYQTFTDLTSFGSTTLVPIPDVLENYVLSQLFKIRKEDDKANAYDTMFREQIELLKLMQRKQAGPPRYLWSFRGRNADKRYFGTRDVYSDTTKELYW